MQPKLIALGLSAALCASADTIITVFDGVFAPSNWTSSILTDTNNIHTSFAAGQVLTGGDPNEYRHTTLTASPNGSGLCNTIRVQNEYLGFSLAAGTPVTSIGYSFDLIYFNPNSLPYPTEGYYLALFQNGKTWVPSSYVPSDTSTWATHTVSGLTASGFCLAGNVNALDCGQHPLFDGSAGMDFGYVTANGLPNSDYYGLGTLSGLDNFTVNVQTTTPEPGTYGMAAAGLALLAWARRRRFR